MIKMVKNRLALLEQKKDNRGAAIILTIAAIAMLCFMVSIILTLSAYNVRMKATDLQGKKTFYTAETAMDEIRAGLQQDVASAMSEAYTKTMESAVATAVGDREALFQTEYVNLLRLKVAEELDSTHYKVEYLKGFLKKTAYDDTKHTGARLEVTDNTLDLTNAGLVLNNIVLRYYGENGYTSEIKTDIILQFPDIDLTQGASAMDFLSYVMIANDKLVTNASTVSAKGSTYAGKNGADFISSSVSFEKLGSAETRNVLITNESLSSFTGSTFRVSDMEVWAKNLVMDSGTVQVKGDTFLSNDMVINNNTGGIVSSNLKLEGNYYGYGSLAAARSATSLAGQSVTIEKNPAEYSSAILVNGAKATVDLSGLDTMMIAGNAYVAASEQNVNKDSFATGTENQDVAMGESVSIKSNQTAYLVPAECVAPTSDYGKTNPMPAEKYNRLLQEVGGDTTKLVDLNQAIAANYGVTLSQLGVTGYKTVCYPVQKIGSMVYLFMEFDTEASANNFFVKYYSTSANLSRLESNLDLYTYGIKVPDSMDLSSPNSTFYYNGNIVVNDENKSSFYVNKLQTVTAEESADMLSAWKSYYDIFYALGKNLTREYSKLTAEELLSDVYGNLVESMTGADAKKNISAGSAKVFVTAGVEAYGALVVNGDYTISSTDVSGMDAEGNLVNSKLRLVIASGNVKVASDFKGMILAGGQIVIDGDVVNLEAAPSEVAVALTTANADGVRPADYLKGTKSLLIGGSTGSASEDGRIDISDLIVYRNWKKQ